MVAVGVVLFVRPKPHLHIGCAATALVGESDGTILRRHAHAVAVGDGVAQKVGLRLLCSVRSGAAQGVHRPPEL
jgi:hypothetical protein